MGEMKTKKTTPERTALGSWTAEDASGTMWDSRGDRQKHRTSADTRTSIVESKEERGKSRSDSAFLSVVGYSYAHPTLGPVLLDADLVELAYLSIVVQAANETRAHHPFLKFDFDKETFPRTSATGNRPFVIVQPELRPQGCPTAGISPPGVDCPNLLTFPQAIRYARRCARNLIGSETHDFVNHATLEFISERLELITEYVLWCDALVVEEWTFPVLCSSLPFGFRQYYCWRRRKDWEVKFASFYGKDPFTYSEITEKFVLDLLSQILQFVVQSLRTASYLSGNSRPGILDGVVFSHLSVLLSTPVSDHSGLSPILTDNQVVPLLKEYCFRMNSIVRSGIWTNSETFLLGLTASAAPYPNNPNSARSQRESRQKNVARISEEANGKDRQEDEDSSTLRALRWPRKLVSTLYRHVTQPLVVNMDQESKKIPTAQTVSHQRETRFNAVHPEIFIAISAVALLGFLLSGKSPIQFSSK